MGPPLFSLGGQGTGPREVHMAKRQTSSKSFHAVAGALLLSLGLLLLFANLDEVAAQVNHSFTSAGGSLGTVIELGLAGMRAVQAYFFDQSTFQAGRSEEHTSELQSRELISYAVF